MKILAIRGLAVGSFAALALAVTACGQREIRLPETGADLSGTVTYGSDSINFALIIVAGKDGTQATGNIDDDGKYHITNVPLGEVKVAVNTEAGYGDFMSKSMSKAYQGPDGKGGGKKKLGTYTKVPAKYHDVASSPLKTTIQKGPNTFNIKISK